jgi:retron-type reverse transcriptase
MRIFSMGDRWCNENRIRLLESRMMRKYQVRFGGGQTKKGSSSHLVGWLPTFSDHSHGFRPERGPHTALREIYHQWTGTAWFIEGDISQCFDKLNHELLLNEVSEHIHDGRFNNLLRELLDAGYMEEWDFNQTLSGVPQGGIVSPILSNILLNKLDRFVETDLIPRHTKGIRRRANPEYAKLIDGSLKHRKQGETEKAEELRRKAQTMPSKDVNDPDYRRLKYVRYADDFLRATRGRLC